MTGLISASLGVNQPGRLMVEWLKQFNTDYANAVQAITPVILGVVSWVYYKLYKESKLKEGDATSIVSPVFWSFGRRFKILAVHQYEASDQTSGYTHISQNCRPDQWQKLIEVRQSILGLRHEIIPKGESDILEVVISRNGAEKWKVVPFNK